MSLPWVRLDSNIASHDKIMALLDEKPEALALRAAWSFTCSIGYCGAHGTDGLIRFTSLPAVHGSKKAAELLVKHRLWMPHPLGWVIPKFLEKQQAQAETDVIRAAQSIGGVKGNCVRWHGPECGCWVGTDRSTDRSTESVPRILRTDGRTDGESPQLSSQISTLVPRVRKAGE